VSAYPELRGVAIPGSMGENLSATEMTDAVVCIGDCYRIGTTIVQVSQPRSPCWKIDHRFGVEQLSVYVEKQRITGWYYRVMEAGAIRVGDSIELLDRPNEYVPVAYFLRVTTESRPDPVTLDRLIACRGLADEWTTRLKNRRDYLRTALQT
ncbi:MAG: MOSC domain-containing protein, partial [Gammaproteobacteria bacterium]|nr:MOSC domain-containing protein [Gammaproteobacteria bacterium]